LTRPTREDLKTVTEFETAAPTVTAEQLLDASAEDLEALQDDLCGFLALVRGEQATRRGHLRPRPRGRVLVSKEERETLAFQASKLQRPDLVDFGRQSLDHRTAVELEIDRRVQNFKAKFEPVLEALRENGYRSKSQGSDYEAAPVSAEPPRAGSSVSALFRVPRRIPIAISTP
jgi:hypothetical protein